MLRFLARLDVLHEYACGPLRRPPSQHDVCGTSLQKTVHNPGWALCVLVLFVVKIGNHRDTESTKLLEKLGVEKFFDFREGQVTFRRNVFDVFEGSTRGRLRDLLGPIDSHRGVQGD